MTDEQTSILWAFSRGDTAPKTFESWFLEQEGLESALGEDLHWALTSSDYRDRDTVWKLRQSLGNFLAATKNCECPSIKDLAVIPMGGGLDEIAFSTLDQVAEYGSEKWWLYASRCRICGQSWLIAQDERIHDNFHFKRIASEELAKITELSKWPEDFFLYEQVLRLGRESGHTCTFFDQKSPALVWTAEELREARRDISIEEIAYVLDVSESQAEKLLRK